jgi:DNA-binding NtrC family response regulator
VAFLGWARPAEASAHLAESETLRLRAELEDLRERLSGRHGFDGLVGRGAGHRRLLDQLAAAAASRVPVLVLGEPGTGRRLVARTIHYRGQDAKSPLLMYDCAALPAEVIERELLTVHAGPAGVASGERPTLLLTEIAELPRDVQARLTTLLDGPARLIATSAVEPDVARRDGRLRPELFFALTTLVVRLLPLRERIEELPLLAQHFLDRANARGLRRLAGIDADALRVLSAYDWPGNLRELSRVIDAVHQRAAGDAIGAGDLPAAIRGSLGAAYNPPAMPPPVTPLDETLTQIERRLIEQALVRARQNKSRAAELLAISRPRLYRRIKELGIADEPEPTEGLDNGQPGEAES